MNRKLIRFRVMPRSPIYPISSAVIWKAELKHPKSLKAGFETKSPFDLLQSTVSGVFKLCFHQLFLSVVSLICIPTCVPARVQTIPRKFIVQKEQRNANDIYWQISVEKVFQILPFSGCQRGFTVSGTFPLGAAPLLDIELTLFLFVLSPFPTSSIFSAASSGFYLFSPNHSDPVSISVPSLRIHHGSAVMVYSCVRANAPRLPGSVTLLYPLLGRNTLEELPPRQRVPKGTFSQLFLVLDAFVQPKEPPVTVPGEEVSGAKLGHFHCCGHSHWFLLLPRLWLAGRKYF